MTPSPNICHQEISLNFSRIISSFLCLNPVGKVFYAPCDVVLSKAPLLVVEPDLVFVSKEHSAIITEKNIQGVPDLTVEILSPRTEMNDRRVKHSLYECVGVSEYWIVDPETKSVQAFRLEDGRYGNPLEFGKEDKLSMPLLPGLSILLSEVFPS